MTEHPPNDPPTLGYAPPSERALGAARVIFFLIGAGTGIGIMAFLGLALGVINAPSSRHFNEGGFFALGVAAVRPGGQHPQPDRGRAQCRKCPCP